MSKKGQELYGRAHFVKAGKPLCSRLTNAYGEPYTPEFKCSWVAIHDRAMKCRLCEKALLMQRP